MKTSKAFKKRILKGKKPLDLDIKLTVTSIVRDSASFYVQAIAAKNQEPMFEMGSYTLGIGDSLTIQLSLPVEVILSDD